MKRTFYIGLFILTVLYCPAQQVTDYKSLDARNPIIFGGKYIVYQGKTITLGPKAFFIDGQFTDEEAAKYPYVFNSVNMAAKHLTNGTGESPMVLYIAPYVYWIDDPDDPAIRLPGDGSTPFGLIIKCEWLRFYGLTDNAENVVLACNRGQTLGSQGNFTMFKFSGQGTSSENITFGNYCNIDLVYPLKPVLNRVKRASAIVQAQLILCDGDKIVARNTRFVSRLNLCPFVGGKRVLFDRCHFECTDDALCATGLYLNSTFDFYSSKPFFATTGTGVVLLNCDIRAFTRGDQYFTKGNGQVAILDSRLTTTTSNYWGWKDVIPHETRNYQYNVSFNGKSVLISKNDPASTVDMTRKPLLDAYLFVRNGEVIYNTYNLLCGNDGWDPMGIKDVVLIAEKESGKKYTMLPVQLLITPKLITIEKESKVSDESSFAQMFIPPGRITIETKKNSARLTAKVNRFGNYELKGETPKWSVAPEYTSLVELKVSSDGMTCDVIPTNFKDETIEVIVTASTPSGLEAANVLNVAPSKLDPPGFISVPKITNGKNGKLFVDYKLDMRFDDQSLVSWYRCTDAKGSNPVEILVSRMNKPLVEYELSTGDIGYYLMVSVAPKHVRCDAGKAVIALTKKPISIEDVKTDNNVLYTDFRNVSTKDQPEIIPGFWTMNTLQPPVPDGRPITANDKKDAWYFGEGSDGAANMVGLLQGRNAGLSYTPVGNEFGDMKVTMTVAPFKTAGQGFSIAHLYMDVLLKLDAKTMTGYALRFIRTTKYHDAVDCVFVKYENGNVVEISEPVSTTCYRTPCNITIEVKGNKMIAHAESPAGYYIVPDRPEVVKEVNMEAEIVPNKFGGFGIQYKGGSPTMIKELKVEWKNPPVYGQVKANEEKNVNISMHPFLNSVHHWYDIAGDDKIVHPILNQPRCKETEITKIADNMLIYQRDNGGWPKNYDMQAILTDRQVDSLMKTKNVLNTTFDNSTTYTHIEYLAKVYNVTKLEKYKNACIKGINFVLSAQYSNGGWPQYYPLQDNYSRRITFNDGAYMGIMEMLKKILDNDPDFSFLGDKIREKVNRAYKKGLECILNCQITDNGRLTAWGQQHNEIDLKPAWARAYEMPSICNAESVPIVLFLMNLDHPDKRIIKSVQSAVKWFNDSKIYNTRVETIPGSPEGSQWRLVTTDRVVVNDSLAPPIWTRFYELGTEKPLFSDRTSKSLYSLAEVSRERRTGYTWYTYEPKIVLDKYPGWQKKWAPAQNVLNK